MICCKQQRIDGQHGYCQHEICLVEARAFTPEGADDYDRKGTHHIARLRSERGSRSLGKGEGKEDDGEREKTIVERQAFPTEDENGNWQKCKGQIKSVSQHV